MMRFTACLVALACSCIAQESASPVATRIRLEPAGSSLYATIAGADKKIANGALKAWLINGGRSVAYSAADGAGGYENEGQSVHLYDVSTGSEKKILSEYFVVTGIDYSETASGSPVLLVSMVDGGLGASHLAVVDPLRGEVFSADSAEFVRQLGDNIEIGWFHDDDWEKIRANVEIKPYKTKSYNLGETSSTPGYRSRPWSTQAITSKLAFAG